MCIVCGILLFRYKGFTATIISGVPFVALQMTLYGVSFESRCDENGCEWAAHYVCFCIFVGVEIQDPPQS